MNSVLRTLYICILCLAVFGILSATVRAQPVPLGDRVYTLIDFMEQKEWLPALPLDTRPLDRQTVASVLIVLEERRRTGDYLSPVLRNELRRQLEEYHREVLKLVSREWWSKTGAYSGRLQGIISSLGGIRWPETMWGADGHVLERDFPDGSWFTLDPVYSLRLDRGLWGKNIFRRGWGVALEAGPTPWLQGFFRWQDFAEWGNSPYSIWGDRSRIFDDRIGYVNSTETSLLAYEDLLAGIQLQTGPVSLLLGRDRVRWGPGRRGNLLFSGEAASFSQGRLGITLGKRIRFTSLVGQLAPWPELRETLYTAPSGWIRKVRPYKYISAHRLEISLSNRLRIGLQEAVIFGERAMDLNYLNPFTVYFSEEHDSGDQDNALMAADLWMMPAKGWTFWTELLLDDFQFGKLGTGYHGNKAGWLVGSALTGPDEWSPLEIGLEYAGLRPYVYSHFFPINSYKNWNAPLGLQLQPNSDRTIIWATWWPSVSFRFGCEATYLRHGANTYIGDSLAVNVGGDYDYGWKAGSAVNAPFLAGRLEETSRIQTWFEWEAFENFYLTGQLGYELDYFSKEQGVVLSAGFSWSRPEDRRWVLRGR